MRSFIRQLPSMGRVHQESIDLAVPFDSVASRFSGLAGTVVLMSGTELDCARYHMLAVDPWLSIRAKGRSITIEVFGEKASFEADPFDCVEALAERFSLDGEGISGPVGAGLFGYFSYDLKQRIEILPVTCMDHKLPDLCLYLPSIILVHDRHTGTTTLSIPLIGSAAGDQSGREYIETVRTRFFTALDSSDKTETGNASGDEGFWIDSRGFRSNFSKSAYMAAVARIIEYIKAGDIYQVNLSQRFEAGFGGNAFSLFQALFKKNPAPFFAFVNAGGHQIVSTSPERFIKQNGRTMETRPIKGTFPRGSTPEEDRRLKAGLQESFKDDAELSMIVDLMRNDLGKVATGGSVEVSEHKRLEPYDNVFHLVSIVTAELAEGKNSVDLLRATFPGGSITGCPKVRSMEIIDELETMNRHVYTGSIGYLSFHNTLDLSIAIRTAIIADNKLSFSVGGGIVYDSDPEKEFQETLHKGKTLMETLENSAGRVEREQRFAWVCGRLQPEDEATVAAVSPGFQHGAGVFETIRVADGKALFLGEHLDRFHGSWRSLFGTPLPEITWEQVLGQLVQANGFDKGVFALKLIAADRGAGEMFLAAFLRPYVHRLEKSCKRGIDLVTYPHSRHTPLADHKSLNYLYYLQAGRYAALNKADEALILNPDATVSETNTCSIMAIDKKVVTIPVSDHALPGVTGKALAAMLESRGYGIVRKRLMPAELLREGSLVLTNALMGAVPVLSLDGRPVNPSPGLCRDFNGLLGIGS
ncbi:MAG: aminodeoxychorismate synthase component I [Desulfobacteraceae bacterium]|nr:aminodeoxychorismate synthase component I [Desulfobacteraceae bacterium]